MSSNLKIVMYHYVRNSESTAYKNINAINLDCFNRQIKHFKNNYHVLSLEEIGFVTSGDIERIPDNSLWLTFDDGYRDHIEVALPCLAEEGLSGSFFPAAKPVLENKVLHVNKIHHILAVVTSVTELSDYLKILIEEYRHEYGLRELSFYLERWWKPGRWDPAETMFIKRMLQKGLPNDARLLFTDCMFEKYVTDDEASLSKELYMNETDLKEMLDSGMHIGSHSYSHEWLDTLSSDEQSLEIDRSIRFLKRIGAFSDDWMMCYPYGGYNDSLIEKLKVKGCTVGLTVDKGEVDFERNSLLRLPRIDANYFIGGKAYNAQR